MRGKIKYIVNKFVGKSPKEFNLVKWSDVINLMVDEIMTAGIENYRDELPSKIPLEGIIIYQDKELNSKNETIFKLESLVEDLKFQLSTERMMTPEEKKEIKKGAFYEQLREDKKYLEGLVSSLKKEKRKYFNDMVDAKRKLLNKENENV